MANVTVGSIIDHYKILEEIGRGGMGQVFKALNVNLDKLVAVKTIVLGLANDEIFLNRFRTEARALARLHDPNIVSIYDLRLDDNQWFIVMEYVEGITLAKRIREEKAMPWREALVIFKQMLSAIGHAHRLGIIHRDIKPNNVMITKSGVVKVTDFGLAKDQRSNNHTVVSSTGGTLYYMSPEQVKGLHFTDFRSDIYALGLTFYEMLTGKIPFRKDDTDFTIREAIIRRQFPPPTHFNPDVPVSLNSLVMHAIEKKQEDRFQTIDEMFETIHEFEKESGLALDYEDAGDERQDISEPPTAAYDISFFNDSVPEQVIPELPEIKSKKRYSLGKAALAFSVLIIAIAIIYLFPDADKKQAVMIVTNPEESQIYINDDSVGITPYFSDNIGYSALSLSIRRDNYITLDTLVEIHNDSLNYLSFELTPLSRFSLSLYPEDSEIYLDGTQYNLQSSDEITIPAGNYHLRVTRPGYSRFEQTIDLKPGLNPKINAFLVQETQTSENLAKQVIVNSEASEEKIIEPLISYTMLNIESTPPGATVSIDDKQILYSRTPLQIDSLTPGSHTLRVEKEGYRFYETGIELEDKPENKIYAELIAAEGTLNILIQPWGSIYIDGDLKKKDTNVKYSSVLSAGEHKLRVVHPLYGEWEKVINIHDEEILEIPVNFNNLVNLSVTAFDASGNPIWAEIVIDDKLTGEMTPKEISVRVGQRTIAAKKDGYILVNGERKLMLDSTPDEPIKFIFKKVL